MAAVPRAQRVGDRAGGELSRCVLAVPQCHLENRGALRAVVSGDRWRARVPDRQRRRSAPDDCARCRDRTRALATGASSHARAEGVSRERPGVANRRGRCGRRRCLLRRLRPGRLHARRQGPMDDVTGTVQELLRHVCVADHHRGSRGAALRPAQRLVPDRTRSQDRPSALEAGASDGRGRMGHTHGVPACRGSGTDRRPRLDAARLVCARHRRASVVDADRLEWLDGHSRRARRHALRVHRGLHRANAADLRLSPGEVRHEQRSAALAGGVPRQQGDGRALRLGRRRWRQRDYRRGMEHDSKPRGWESMASSPSVPEPLEGSWTRQRSSGAFRRISRTFQRRFCTRTSCTW